MITKRHIATLLYASIVSCTMSTTAFAQTTLRLSHTDTPVGSRQKAAELSAQKVEEHSKGKLKVQVFHSGQLGNDPKAVEQLQLGGIDFTVTATGTYASHNKALSLAGLPFLVDSCEQRQITARMEDSGEGCCCR